MDESKDEPVAVVVEESKHPLTLIVETGDVERLRMYLSVAIRVWLGRVGPHTVRWSSECEMVRRLTEALERAIELDNLPMVRLLLTEGARTASVCTDSPMSLALRLGRLHIVDEMIRVVDARMSPDFVYKNEMSDYPTAVETAVVKRDFHTLAHILSGVDSYYVAEAFKLAVVRRDLECVQWILPYCETYTLSANRDDALTFALQKGYTEIVDAIIQEREKRCSWWKLCCLCFI